MSSSALTDADAADGADAARSAARSRWTAWLPRPARRPERWLPSRFDLAVALLALVPVGVASVLGVLNSIAASSAAEDRRLADTVHALRLAVDSVLQGYVDAGRVLAAALESDPNDLSRLISRAQAFDQVLRAPVLVIGPPPEFRPLWHSRVARLQHMQRSAETDAAVRPRLEAAFHTGEIQFVDLFSGAFDTGKVLSVQVPVVAGGAVVRVIALVLDPARISEVLRAEPVEGEGNFASLVDGADTIAANSRDPARFVGRKVTAWFTEARAAAPERGQARGLSVAGEDVLLTYERSQLAPRWVVTISESMSAYRAASWRPLRSLGLAIPVVLAVIVVGLLLLWSGRRTARLDAARQREAHDSVVRSLERLPALIYRTRVYPDHRYDPFFVAGDFETVVGWPASDIEPAEAWRQRQEPNAPSTLETLLQAGRDGRSTAEYRLRRADGSWGWLRVSIRLDERLGDGSFLTTGHVLNVTAEREATAQLVAAGRLASLGELAAGLAHELKQPLAAISMAAENADLALEKGDAKAARGKFERIMQQTQRAGDLIEHLRRFARGGDTEPVQAVSLVEVMAGALDIAGSALQQGSVELDMWLGQPPPVIVCQRVPLEHVVLNLLINARDATATLAPGAPRRVLIGARREADNAVITIADNGGGIAPHVMARLFEPFVTTKAPNKGTGLGLAICHGLMRGMNGGISAHNDADGAVFTLTLPLAASDPARTPPSA